MTTTSGFEWTEKKERVFLVDALLLPLERYAKVKLAERPPPDPTKPRKKKFKYHDPILGKRDPMRPKYEHVNVITRSSTCSISRDNWSQLYKVVRDERGLVLEQARGADVDDKVQRNNHRMDRLEQIHHWPPEMYTMVLLDNVLFNQKKDRDRQISPGHTFLEPIKLDRSRLIELFPSEVNGYPNEVNGYPNQVEIDLYFNRTLVGRFARRYPGFRRFHRGFDSEGDLADRRAAAMPSADAAQQEAMRQRKDEMSVE